MQGCYDREYWIVITILCKITGWVGRQNGRKLWSRGGCIYKIEIPIYRFFGIFSSVFGIFRYLKYWLRYRYRYFEIPRYSVSVTDPGLILSLNSISAKLLLRYSTTQWHGNCTFISICFLADFGTAEVLLIQCWPANQNCATDTPSTTTRPSNQAHKQSRLYGTFCNMCLTVIIQARYLTVPVFSCI